jgi:hypothetical protein
MGGRLIRYRKSGNRCVACQRMPIRAELKPRFFHAARPATFYKLRVQLRDIVQVAHDSSAGRFELHAAAREKTDLSVFVIL